MGYVKPAGSAGAQGELERDERWLLVERIIASLAFRRAGRLRDLLRYLAEVSLRGEHPVIPGLLVESDLTEQRIGEMVFGKPSGYSPVEDSSVRVHMRQLRLKLHEYFDSEGREEPLIVEIPKGGYTLSFHPIPVPVQDPAGIEPLAKGPEPAWRRYVWIPLVVLAVAVVWSGVVVWSGSRAPARAPVPWPLGNVFGNGYRTQIVLADATYGIRRLLSQKPASLEAYIRRDFQQNPEAGHAEGVDNYLARYSADALLTSWADVAVATTFLKLLPGGLEQVSVRSARDLRLRDLEEGNYIFLGSPASNPWVLLFENRLNFQEVRGDETRGEVKYFRNRQPRGGEQDTYQGLPRTGVDGEDYAALALLPSESRRGNVLIIQGLQQEGTEAAGLFLSDEGGRQKLKKALGAPGDSATPLYFEVLLRIKAVGGSPSSTTIVASRIVKP